MIYFILLAFTMFFICTFGNHSEIDSCSCEVFFTITYDSVGVKALRYYSEGPGIDPRSCHWGFFSRSIRQVHVRGVDSDSKNEYQDIPAGKGGRCIGVTTLPPSCAECHEIWEPQPPEPL